MLLAGFSYSGASLFEVKLHGLNDKRHLPSVTGFCTHGFAYFLSINFQLSITFNASEVNWFGKNYEPNQLIEGPDLGSTGNQDYTGMTAAKSIEWGLMSA